MFRKSVFLSHSGSHNRLSFLTSNIPWSSAMHAFRKRQQLLGGRFFRGELKWDPVAEEGSVPRETRWPWYTSSAVRPALLLSLWYLLKHFLCTISYLKLHYSATKADSSRLSSRVTNVRLPYLLPLERRCRKFVC